MSNNKNNTSRKKGHIRLLCPCLLDQDLHTSLLYVSGCSGFYTTMLLLLFIEFREAWKILNRIDFLFELVCVATVDVLISLRW